MEKVLPAFSGMQAQVHPGNDLLPLSRDQTIL